MDRGLDTLAGELRPLRGAASDYDALLERAGRARIVLIGEATHGTHEFYQERARITRRLIEQHGFDAVAVEGDWPDAHRVHHFVTGHPHDEVDTRAADALAGFKRFPNWMWRNTQVRDFLSWLRRYNRAEGKAVGFYGLDLYSMYESAAAVIRYLERVDPEAAERARYRYACFEHAGEDSQAYGYAAGFELEPSCEQQVIAQLLEMRRRSSEALLPCAWPLRAGENDEATGNAEASAEGGAGGAPVDEDLFFAQRNAEVVRNAEAYYRTMFRGRVSSWNLRDEHMMDTLDALLAHLRARRPRRAPRIVVWAHNSHVGDARATELGRQGEWTIGKLVRQRHPGESCLLGLFTHEGWVTAASRWDGTAERKRVRPSRPDSYEALLHMLAERTGSGRFWLDLTRDVVAQELGRPRLERAIGVIYRPEAERVSHYFEACLSEQFDALIHLDQTTALEPLEPPRVWRGGEVPKTFPSAL